MIDINDPVIEAAALRESEAALDELLQVFENIGLSKGAVAMMLRAKAAKLEGQIILPPMSEIPS